MTAGQFTSTHPAFPEQSRAWVALVLGILGFATVGVFSPMAWAIGHRELAAIEAGKRSPENRLAAQVGRFLGIAGTAVIVVAASLFLLAVAGVIQGT